MCLGVCLRCAFGVSSVRLWCAFGVPSVFFDAPSVRLRCPSGLPSVCLRCAFGAPSVAFGATHGADLLAFAKVGACPPVVVAHVCGGNPWNAGLRPVPGRQLMHGSSLFARGLQVSSCCEQCFNNDATEWWLAPAACPWKVTEAVCPRKGVIGLSLESEPHTVGETLSGPSYCLSYECAGCMWWPLFGWILTIEGSPVHSPHSSPCNLHFGPARACLRSMAWFSLMTI